MSVNTAIIPDSMKVPVISQIRSRPSLQVMWYSAGPILVPSCLALVASAFHLAMTSSR